MIEESGDNWYYVSGDAPRSIQVVSVVDQIETTETIEHTKKRKRKKAKPFGFARALPAS